MKVNRKKIKKFIFPKTMIVFLLFNITVASLVYVFWNQLSMTPLAYVSYAVSTYTLVVVCARIPGIVKRIRNGMYANRYMNIYLTEKELRIRISLYMRLVINTGIVVFKVIIGAMTRSRLFFAVAGYHAILSIMHFILVYRELVERKEENEESSMKRAIHSYRACGWLMLVLNVAISVIVGMVVVDNEVITYPGITIFAVAVFAFYCMTMAIINVVKYWKIHNPIFSATKRIEFAKALVSIFTLQVALIAQFGEVGSQTARIGNAATGLAVCIMINTMAALMLVNTKNKNMEKGSAYK